LQIGNDNASVEEKSAYITAKLDSMIKEGASEIELRKTIEELQERFSDYGRDRRTAISFHINQLRRCLQPTQTTRAILWLLSCAPMFHDVDGNPKPNNHGDLSELWFSLLDALKPTSEQYKQLMSFTIPKNLLEDPFNEVYLVTENCNQILEKLVEIICNKNESLDNEMANIQAILNPRQIAKFVLWIDQNPVCMQMLEALWPHLTQTKTTCTDSENKTTPSASSTVAANQNMSELKSSRSYENFLDLSEEDYSSTSENEG
jgi:hypothetical protein